MNNTEQHSLFRNIKQLFVALLSREWIQLHSLRKGNSCYYLRDFPWYSSINFRSLGQYQTNLAEQSLREVPKYANWTLRSFP